MGMQARLERDLKNTQEAIAMFKRLMLDESAHADWLERRAHLLEFVLGKTK